MSGAEEAGALATAGLVAGAIEGREGRADGHGGACLNCGAPVHGRYCAACGQPAHVHRSLGHMLEETLHGVAHFDTKAWRTLPRLLFRPGGLTHDYIHGRRARYVGPMALFLFMVFLMFFVFAVLGDARFGAAAPPTPAELAAQKALIERASSRLSASMAQAQAEGDAERIDRIRSAERIVERARAAGRIPPGVKITEQTDGSVNVRLELGEGGEMQTVFDEIRAAHEEGRIHVDTGNAVWDKKIKAKLADPEFAWYKIQNAAYKFSFLIVLLSLPFVWIVFAWRRGVTLFDHSVFVLYSVSFVSLLYMVMAVTNRFGSQWVDFAVTGLMYTLPVHMFFQLKGGYRLGVWSALWRTVYMMVAAALVMTIFFAVIFLLGFLG